MKQNHEVGILWSCVLGLQRPPPRYSQQYMPETSFSCRNKIVGSYYADPETDCQVFHVCVSVAGTIQDYKFLCPNDTAFDQESQTCADWYDVDCEAATLYYSSDNFDLYRIGSGLESVHYDSLRSDAEPQDHLQRSETSDAVRSSANAVNRVSSSNYNNNNNNNNRDILRGSSSGNLYNRNNKEDEYETEKSYKEEVNQDTKKKVGGVRKVSRKQPYNGSGYSSTTTTTSTPAPTQHSYNGNYYSGNYYNNNAYNQRSSTYVASSTTVRPLQENYNRNQNTQRHNVPSSTTYRPSTTYQDTYNNHQSSPSTTVRTTPPHNVYSTNVFNVFNPNYNQQTAVSSSFPVTTLRPSTYSPKANYQSNYQFPQSTTTVQPSTNYQQTSDFNNYQQRSYNNIQRGTSNVAYPSTTSASTVYNNHYNNNNNNNGQYRSVTSTKQDVPQTTAKYFANNFANSYAPTTYSPATKKYVNGDNTVAQTTAFRNNDNNQYYDKSTIKPSTQYYENTKTPKKATQYNNYDGASGGKSYYIETSTGSFDLGRSSIGIGFSPASINHLAESPRTTTPVPRRPSSATTYNPNNFSSSSQRAHQPTTTTPRGITYVSGSARPFTSTTRLPSSSSTTARPKSSKKNDYDYAYYDNTGGVEYDGVDLEHVTSNKESTKITRNN
ncbi:GATA zinc finger domain-containing protein 14-like isoform X2 [Nylanderia fulva]|uniref:GATA zinc finger domain-containing protein 14-like isoform X2 n=1 Tax=Nylanderia fulva TaxID=613905 RepID=UPI0010FAF6E8|nr:GATA zinc finger domain-containing protein 14-like isoform X2 [Nylanderia fulva]